MSIDKLLEAMPKMQRDKIVRQVLVLIHDAESRERADWTGVTKIKEIRMRKRNGVSIP